MRRKRKQAEHINHDRWLVSYADFITLLFALFVVMFATARLDRKKAVKLSAAIQGAFQHLGMFDSSAAHAPIGASGQSLLDDAKEAEKLISDSDLARVQEAAKSAGNDAVLDLPVTELQKELEKELAPEIQRREATVKVGRDGLVISLREIGFFDSGSAKLRPGSEPALHRIATVLAGQQHHVRIEGHTDNVPIHNSQFGSNWELSTARATEIVKLFIMRYGFIASHLEAAGYAEYHPVTLNISPETRAMNRRVDIVVLSRIGSLLPTSETNFKVEPVKALPLN
jgi:chemotaxis protein MotB